MSLEPVPANPLTSTRLPISPTDSFNLLNQGLNIAGPGAMPGSGASSDACAVGSPGGPSQGQGPATNPGTNNGTSEGAQNNNALGSGLNPKLADSFNYAKTKWEAANPGMKVYAFSGVAQRPENPSSRHMSGNAMDVAIYGTDGKLLNNLNNGDTPAYRAYESFASAMGQGYQATQGTSPVGDMRWGGNFGGNWYRDSMHFDVGGGPTSQGNVFANQANPNLPNNSKPSDGITYNGPKDGATANSGGAGRAEGAQNNSALSSQNNTKNATCSPSANSNGGGCDPMSMGALGVLSSLMGGLGLGNISGLLSSVSSITSGIGGVLSGNMFSALGTATGAIASFLLKDTALRVSSATLPGVIALTQAGLPNVLTGITYNVAVTVETIGNDTLPSITGVMPANITDSSGMTGLVTTNFNNAVDSIIQPGANNLGGFPSIFNMAMGASASSNNLQKALTGTTTQIFGRAGDGVLGDSSSMPGYDLANIGAQYTLGSEDEGIEALGGVLQDNWIPNITNSVSLVKPMKEVLPELVNRDTINGFSSLFKDYNSMITQGYGNLTDNLQALGVDLYNLGLVGDLTDLLNIGTARQLVRQLVEHGLGNKIGLLDKLAAQGLSVQTIQNDDAETTVFDILCTINDADSIAAIMATMKITGDVQLRNAGDLLVTDRALPLSYKYNYFTSLNDMALTLAISGTSIGTMKTFNDLGFVMLNMENAQDFTDLNNEYTVVRYDEAQTLQSSLPPSSKFNENGPVLADFIGSAAGYIHSTTFPVMATLHNTIFSNTLLQPYKDLMTVLTATLNGTYSGGGVVNPPDTAKYAIGSYSTLDAAVTAICGMINTELAYVKATAPNSDPTFWAELQKYEALHYASAEYLGHEKVMRKAYGIDLGDPRVVTNFYGDGTTTTFPLDDFATGSVVVSVAGTYEVQNVDYVHDTANAQIVFKTAPAAHAKISITYEVNTVQAEPGDSDSWQFASSIESFALDTGYGGPADMLNKMATDDMHGQRIKAVMMQARNKVRLENVGVSCPGFNRVLNTDDSKDFNFIDKTGIWSTHPSRAAEIYLQNTAGVNYLQEYILEQMQQNASSMKPDNDILMANVTRQLIFLTGDQLAITNAGAAIYASSLNNGLFIEQRPDMVFTFQESPTTDGYLLGNGVEIISAICAAEGYTDSNFDTPLSPATQTYLDMINIDLSFLTSVFQRALVISLASSLGIAEEEARQIFGVQSVSQNILANIANNV